MTPAEANFILACATWALGALCVGGTLGYIILISRRERRSKQWRDA
jgi:hypothetical protein